MREIEVKLYFADKKLSEVRAVLGGDWSKPYTQEDRIFLPESMHTYKITPGTKVCRVRRETSSEDETSMSLTMKIQQTEALHSIEYETGITEEIGATAMLKEFGFREFVSVEKIRMKSTVGDYSLCLDEVRHLGLFLEVERLMPHEDIDAVAIQEEMIDWVRQQGLNDFTISTVPYDTQTYNLLQSQSEFC